MQDVVGRARLQAADIVEAIKTAETREEAVASLAESLAIDRGLAENLLELRFADLLPSATSGETQAS